LGGSLADSLRPAPLPETGNFRTIAHTKSV